MDTHLILILILRLIKKKRRKFKISSKKIVLGLIIINIQKYNKLLLFKLIVIRQFQIVVILSEISYETIKITRLSTLIKTYIVLLSILLS